MEAGERALEDEFRDDELVVTHLTRHAPLELHRAGRVDVLKAPQYLQCAEIYLVH